MKIFCRSLISVFLFIPANGATSQKLQFSRVVENKGSGTYQGILGITQDRQGYMWMASQNSGLLRYDGREMKSYKNDPSNINSPANNFIMCVCADSNNIIWMGSFGFGLDSYDPETNKFIHFRHDPKNSSSLINDTVWTIVADHRGNLWIGTFGGLDMFDKMTGKFIHYTKKTNDAASLPGSIVNLIYEDHSGNLWIGSGSDFSSNGIFEKCTFSRFDKTTGKFKRYQHDPDNPNSISDGEVSTVFEDSKGIFWVGGAGNGLQSMDRDKGIFTHYYYDSLHPEKLSRPRSCSDCIYDQIAFIKEDAAGDIWIGSNLNGINQYDPVSKKVIHYGAIKKKQNSNAQNDTTKGGYNDYTTSTAFSSLDGSLWIGSFEGNVYNTNVLKTIIPFYTGPAGDPSCNTFYYEPNTNALWIGTDKGLLREDLINGNQRVWKSNFSNANCLCNDTISAMRSDEGKLWMTTNNGLCKFDPETNIFTTYRANDKNSDRMIPNQFSNLCISHDKDIWITTWSAGIYRLDSKKNTFTHYIHDDNDTSSLSYNVTYSVVEDNDNRIWIGTDLGLNLLDVKTGKFHHYLNGSAIKNIFIDYAGVLWAGANDGLYQFDHKTNQFLPYVDPNSKNEIKNVLHIMEDDEKNLWVSTNNSFIKINEGRDEVKIYTLANGVHENEFAFADNFKGKNGELFFGDQTGYYAFFPNQLKDKNIPPYVNITRFKLGDEEVKPKQGSVLNEPLWKTTAIKLNYNQNIFSFDFNAINYNTAGDEKYLFKLENYDNTWHFINTDNKAYFFNIPPGNYIFHVKAVNADGVWAEKTIKIIITPPWWRTWWAYAMYIICFLLVSIFANRIIRNRIIEKERQKSREKELQQAKEIEKAYNELKSTQAQLIQSEKMASLGELTAGIAHEIQNPLNFVNNFSDVNTELIDEAKQEMDKGNTDEVKTILEDIKENEEKINHHGKRADAIVKNMLQHSRTSTGQKELTDINALADEYLRLSYHGMRAKDKTFNAEMKTDFDKSIGKINIIPQDIGRVLLNLFNNAFYAVNEKKKTADESYKPEVEVETEKKEGKITITVCDNGNGIPQDIIDKIFQPFFTTKPTGEGTGLGLSLSYDIIKAHGGEIKVNTKENEGTEFTIQLPVV
jgi:signal transduction histidine kinase/ligand-binding sensor domain-containing protein